MNGIDRLLFGFQDECIIFGSDQLFPIQIAARFVEQCAQQNLAVIGIDIFSVDGNKRTPVDTVDLSSLLGKDSWSWIVQECQSNCVSILQSINEVDQKRFCSFTAMSQAEWSG